MKIMSNFNKEEPVVYIYINTNENIGVAYVAHPSANETQWHPTLDQY